MSIALQSAWDWEGFRLSARLLLRYGVAPREVSWQWLDTPAVAPQADLFADGGAPCAVSVAALEQWLQRHAAGSVGIAVPRLRAQQLQICQSAALHCSSQRYLQIYRWLHRIAHAPSLRDDPLDADAHAIAQMAKAVGREIHKMRAFVRFRPVADANGDTHHVAWFEPEHFVILANAPFFIRRFANMRWSILSPQVCMHWDMQQLFVGAGADASQRPAPDAGEDLWLTYYATTFNPARLKTGAMLREMPRKYWRNLPEARLITPLIAQAGPRSARMLEGA